MSGHVMTIASRLIAVWHLQERNFSSLFSFYSLLIFPATKISKNWPWKIQRKRKWRKFLSLGVSSWRVSSLLAETASMPPRTSATRHFLFILCSHTHPPPVSTLISLSFIWNGGGCVHKEWWKCKRASAGKGVATQFLSSLSFPYGPSYIISYSLFLGSGAEGKKEGRNEIVTVHNVRTHDWVSMDECVWTVSGFAFLQEPILGATPVIG